MATAAYGFTLVELLITVVILAVVAMVAVPATQQMIHRSRLTASANEVVATLQLARMEAVRRNRIVEVCPTVDGSSCGGADWSRLVVRTRTGNNVVRDVRVTNQGLAATVSPNVSSNNRVAFDANGLARIGAALGPAGVLSVCSPRLPAAENTLDIRINASRVGIVRRNGTGQCVAAAD